MNDRKKFMVLAMKVDREKRDGIRMESLGILKYFQNEKSITMMRDSNRYSARLGETSTCYAHC